MAGRDLTGEELAVLRLASQGLTLEQAADELGVSIATVTRRRADIFRKLRAKTLPHAVAIAIRQGLIDG